MIALKNEIKIGLNCFFKARFQNRVNNASQMLEIYENIKLELSNENGQIS